MSIIVKAKWIQVQSAQTPPPPGAIGGPTSSPSPDTWYAVDEADEIIACVSSYDGGITWNASLYAKVGGLVNTTGMFISLDAAKKRIEWWLRKMYAFTNARTDWALVVSP